jgi:hypothetical protein
MMAIQIRRGTPKDAQMGRRLLSIEIGLGLDDVDDLSDELQEYKNILLGRDDSPIDSPYLAMMEVATAYYARAMEIDSLIHKAERQGAIMRGSPLYRFRTGELRAFIELSKKCTELGSRRLTQESLLEQQRFEE